MWGIWKKKVCVIPSFLAQVSPNCPGWFSLFSRKDIWHIKACLDYSAFNSVPSIFWEVVRTNLEAGELEALVNVFRNVKLTGNSMPTVIWKKKTARERVCWGCNIPPCCQPWSQFQVLKLLPFSSFLTHVLISGVGSTLLISIHMTRAKFAAGRAIQTWSGCWGSEVLAGWGARGQQHRFWTQVGLLGVTAAGAAGHGPGRSPEASGAPSPLHISHMATPGPILSRGNSQASCFLCMSPHFPHLEELLSGLWGRNPFFGDVSASDFLLSHFA